MTDTLTVGELHSAVADALANRFANEVWVTGAIRSLNRSGNGHVYFDLVDPDHDGPHAPMIPVVLFASVKPRVNQILKKSGAGRMEDGVEIRLRGRLAVHESRGRIQLVMSLIDPSFTLGRLAAERAAVMQRLADDGLLGANALLDLPRVPLRVALVTSAGSAAHADFIDELVRSRYRFEVTVFDSRVQGSDAPADLRHAVAEAQRPIDPTVDDTTHDVIVITRGGGSRGDLLAFDDEPLARAIAGSDLPVVVGVGHEIDRAIADEVAHTSVKTPTAAARVLVDACDHELARIVGCSRRLELAATHATDRRRGDLDALERRLAGGVERRLDRAGVELRQTAERIRRAAERRLDDHDRRLAVAAATVRGNDPERRLARGWSFTRTVSGNLVSDPGDVAPGDEVITTVAGGTIRSTVTTTEVTPTEAVT